MPRGLVWDAINYSCGYDALFTILFNVWKGNPTKWHQSFNAKNEMMKTLSNGFFQSTNQVVALELVRDQVRTNLNHISPQSFPYGQNGISIDDLCAAVIGQNVFCATGTKTCLRCLYVDPEEVECLNEFHCLKYQQNVDGVMLKERIFNDLSGLSGTWCPECRCENEAIEMQLVPRLHRLPDLFIVSIQQNGSNFPIEHKLHFDLNGNTRVLLLRGVIYLGSFHFTSRVIGSDGRLWFHDGISTGRACIDERRQSPS
ncbi:hypothetical protein C8R44DRAFT_632156 [Mycena epipterygia]|nr:hypothetical protein C8R44DRAFT_632156 [Mycena epipterygia]